MYVKKISVSRVYSSAFTTSGKTLRHISLNMDIVELGRNADFEWATRLNRIMLNFIGIWPSAQKNVCNKFLSNIRVTFAFIVLLFIGIIPLILSLMEIWDDLFLLMDNLQFTLTITVATIKLIVVWWKKTELLMVINMVADDWIKTKTDKERDIMIQQAQNARILTMAGYGIMSLGFVLLIILPYFGKSVRYITNVTVPIKVMPFPTHNIYDRSPYFEIIFVAQTFVILISAAAYSGVDTLLGLLIFHVCGQFENLKEKLINIQFINYNKCVASIVKEHIRLIKCFEVIENTYTLLLLGLLIYFGITFSLFGFVVVAILKEGIKVSAMRLLFLISTMLNIAGHTCLFCAVGEILITKCNGMHHATYEHEWYKVKPQKAKAMILILIRANKPLYITAGKMFPMTMSMFCNLLKTSAGYVSVLLAMQN